MGDRGAFRADDDQVGGLLDLMLRVGSDLDLRGVLERLVEAGCSLTGARYGFLGVVDEAGTIADFAVHGLSEEERDAIGPLPEGKGVLGLLIEEPQSLRLEDIAAHPRSVGFPGGHPPMTSFLGTPVVVDGAVYGNLYLTEKQGAAAFTAEDEEVVGLLAQSAGLMIAHARTYAAEQRRHAWLEAALAMSAEVAEISATGDLRAALEVVAGWLAGVARATAVVAVRPDGPDPEFEAVAAWPDLAGAHGEELAAKARPLIAEAARAGRVIRAGSPSSGQVLAVPVRTRLAPEHVLVVRLEVAGAMLPPPEEALFAAFADQAALALDRTQALGDRAVHLLVADRGRIARDLHDTVIQRIFATAMGLQLLGKGLPEQERSRISDSIGELNTTIRQIRSTIFELNRPGDPIEARIRALSAEYADILGFEPDVEVDRDLDGRIDEAAAQHLLAALREALSNVARHARAGSVRVEVALPDGALRLRVRDDGRGLAQAEPGFGLRNLADRAAELGGTCSVGPEESPEEGTGTLLEWRVPMA